MRRLPKGFLNYQIHFDHGIELLGALYGNVTGQIFVVHENKTRIKRFYVFRFHLGEQSLQIHVHNFGFLYEMWQLIANSAL